MNIVNRVIYVMDTECDLCKVRTKLLYVICMNASLRVVVSSHCTRSELRLPMLQVFIKKIRSAVRMDT
jgi:hypothetical protein